MQDRFIRFENWILRKSQILKVFKDDKLFISILELNGRCVGIKYLSEIERDKAFDSFLEELSKD